MNSPFDDAEIKTIRQNFPFLETGRVYLNHAAISPYSKEVKNALDTFIQERHIDPIENFEQSVQMSKETRSLVAKLIQSSTTDLISYVGNTSDAISAVAEGFPWKSGDQVVLNRLEFPANVQPFRILKNRGVEIVFAEDRNGKITPEQIEAAITPKTKMVSISAVQYLTGYRADLKNIGELCRSHNIFFVVDGIQGLGAVPIHVEEMHIDALGSGGHKWLMSPMGIGFLYLSEKLAAELKPYKTGWLSVTDPWDLSNFDQPWLPVSNHLETGTPNMLGITGLGASLKTYHKWSGERISKQVLKLSTHIIESLQKYPGVDILTPVKENERAGIVTFSSQNHPNPDETVQDLKKKKITISARKGMFRLAPHYYNTTEEIDFALEQIFINQ